ncbi:MAG: hypothetical protein J1F09_02470 [Oscillospiraceae bacterium]|nr:hypothetical protein [Oscillospiraceae bacterium]
MSDDRYSIDDILKEIDTKRYQDGDDTASTDDDEIVTSDYKPESVTEILDGDAINRALAGSQKKKPDLSVTQVINSLDRKKGRSARQLTEEESDKRRNADISKAFGNKKKPKPQREKLSARQLTEEETDERRSLEISRAADIKKWEKLREEESSEDEYVYEGDFEGDFEGDLEGNFEDSTELVTPESEYVRPYRKPEVSGADDDIIFHTRGDLVTTDTAQIRKQKKIDDINRALLKIDSEADSPDDMLNALNPMDSREKAVEIIKGNEDDNTDTLAVAGNDLKRIAKGEERIKEYQPAKKREADEVLFAPPGAVPGAAGMQSPVFPAEIHVGETIVEALNKKISEQSSPRTEEESVPQTTEEPAAFAARSPEEEEALERIRQADELAQKKKRKIANFILDTPDTEELEPAVSAPADDYSEDYDDEDDEPIDLDDENVIRDRLERASKGLLSRLLILAGLFAVTLFVTLANKFNMELGGLNKVISLRVAPDNYLYTHLTVGILSFAACSSVISNGFSRLLKLRPDGDTLCAFAHMGALAALIPYLINAEYIQRGRAHVYLLVSLGALLFNTLSKICTVKTAQKNFAFTFGGRAKYFIERCERTSADKLAKGAVSGIPAVGAMRKTEILCDFIVSTYCEDASDRLSRKIVPAAAAAAVVGAIAAFFASAGETDMVINRVNWAVTVMTAIFALGASFSGSMTVTLPLLFASLKNNRRGSAILGYNAATELSELNAVLLEAKTLFPADSVKITNICGYDKPKNRGEGKINIDEAIIYAASLAVASDSVLADAFFGMLNNKRELLKPVSGCVYENNLGVMGWIDRRRVLLGNRRHMKSHEITVPNMKKESAANVNNDEVIYLAVGGEVCLLFFVELSANPAVKLNVQRLTKRDVSLVIRTVDGMMTEAEISELFDIDSEKVKILPFEAHETFAENTKFVSSGSASASCIGTFSSFAGAVCTARLLRDRTVLSCIVQLSCIGLGVLLAIIFALFTQFGFFDALYLLLFNIATGAITLGAQLFKRL